MNKNRIYIILGIAGIIALIAIAIFLRKPTTPAPSVTPKSETATPTESVIQTPATEKEKTEVPSTQEKKETKQLSSCVILDEEYCKKGKVAKEKGFEWVRIGFNIPGANVYSPTDGTLQPLYFQLPEGKGYPLFYIETSEGEFIAFENMILNPDLEEEMEKGSPRVSTIEFPPEKPGGATTTRKLIQVKKGELIGKISDKFYVEGYNLGIFFPTIKSARQYFPYVE